MLRDTTFDDLWSSAPVRDQRFDPAQLQRLPEGAQRYLRHALSPGARLATAARLRMHGTLRLKGEWLPFSAEQVLRWDRGFVWRARTRMSGLPIHGFDRLVDGEAAMKWKALGIVPVVDERGPEIARSAAGRLHAESIWLPAVLLGADVRWHQTDRTHADCTILSHGEESHIDLGVDERGSLRTLRMPRWGDLGTGDFRYETFGGYFDAERAFDGVTIPTELRMGWFFGTERFATEGEFFRATVDEVEHR